MTFKPKQLDSEATKVFNETEVGVLLESVDSKLDLILETQKGMRDDIKGIRKDHKDFSNRMDHVEIRLDVVEAR